jgi:hypothetical protein
MFARTLSSVIEGVASRCTAVLHSWLVNFLAQLSRTAVLHSCLAQLSCTEQSAGGTLRSGTQNEITVVQYSTVHRSIVQ